MNKEVNNESEYEFENEYEYVYETCSSDDDDSDVDTHINYNMCDKKNKFHVVLVKNIKKFKKYVKVNKIKGMNIIDMNEILLEEKLSLEQAKNSTYLKLVIMDKIKQSEIKNKDIYFIPYIPTFDFNKIKNHKSLTKHDFDLLYFFDDFESHHKEVILSNLDIFDNVQILKDY